MCRVSIYARGDCDVATTDKTVKLFEFTCFWPFFEFKTKPDGSREKVHYSGFKVELRLHVVCGNTLK